MKILHIIGRFDKKNGGVYSAILSIAGVEHSLGYKSGILSIESANQEYDASLFSDGVHLFKRSFPYVFSPSKDAEKWLETHVENYDLLILHEVWAILAVRASAIAKKHGIKYIIWPHGSLDPFDLKKKKLLKKVLGNMIIRSVTANAAAICCTSDTEKNVIQTYNRRDKLTVKVLPLPIDYAGNGNRTRFRREHGISESTFAFLFLSRVDYKKGLDLFLYAYKALIDDKKKPDIKLIIAGNGSTEYEVYILELIGKLGLYEYIHFAGFLSGSEKADAFAASDCFILPSMNENYGISVIEALQSDLPVLISDNVYIWKDIIPEGGWICRHDVNSIYNSLVTIYNDHLTKNIKKKSPGKTGEIFTTSRLISEYAGFYSFLNRSRSDRFQTALDINK